MEGKGMYITCMKKGTRPK